MRYGIVAVFKVWCSFSVKLIEISNCFLAKCPFNWMEKMKISFTRIIYAMPKFITAVYMCILLGFLRPDK